MTFLFGTIIGSFLNVVIYRLHTGRSLNGRSHCMTCGTHLMWYELFPVVSYLVLRGSCRTCSAHIPSRYFIVEVITGSAFVLLWYLYGAIDVWLFFLNAFLIAVLIVLAVYDIRHTIIPDELTVLIGGVALLFLGHQYLLGGATFSALLLDIFGGILGGAFFGGLWYVSKGHWLGLGDAKLAIPLGIIVGITGVFSMVILSFWIGAAISLVLLGMQRFFKTGKTRLLFGMTPLTIKSEVPFAPFLVAGFLLVHLFHASIFDITLALMPF